MFLSPGPFNLCQVSSKDVGPMISHFSEFVLCCSVDLRVVAYIMNLYSLRLVTCDKLLKCILLVIELLHLLISTT